MQPNRTAKSVFIVGTDTEVGKTYQACRLARTLAAKGARVGVYKPVASGVPSIESADETSDGYLLNEATGGHWPVERVCPQSFVAPLAPPMAAELEGKVVDELKLVEGIDWWQDQCDVLLVEGAGGVLSPISHSMTVLDLTAKLGLPLILVAANRLGVVNHALLSAEVIRSRGLDLLGVVLNDVPSLPSSDAGSEVSNAQSLGGVVDPSTATNSRLLSMFLPNTKITADIEEFAEGL